MNPTAPLPAPAPRPEVHEGAWLLGRVAHADADALAELYRAWGDRLYSMALHWLGDEGAARELLQDCFLRVWHKAGQFDPAKSAAFTWCAMLLRGLCLDHLRKRRLRAPVWQPWDPALLLEIPARDGIEDLSFRETVTSVRAALATLAPDEAESVGAALFDPGTVADHAARWGVPVGTAKIRIHRAMTKLRVILTQNAHEASH